MKNVSLLITLCLIFVGCSSKLSNDDATKIISSNYPSFCTSNRIITQAYFLAGQNNNNVQEKYDIMRKLEDEGLIKINMKTSGLSSYPDKIYTYELSNDAKQKYNGQIALTSNEFLKIIGISQTDNEAKVRYKVKSIKTPLYILHNKYNGKYQCFETEWEEDVTLTKFDTGWQINKK